MQLEEATAGRAVQLRRIRAEYPDEPLIPWLLRFRSQRPCANEATNDFYELPSLHGFPPS
jgi:hypothetical protein